MIENSNLNVTSKPRSFSTFSGRTFELPLFLPVYQPENPLLPFKNWQEMYEVEGCIVNAFFLYKQKEVRELFKSGAELHEYINFDGLVMTDSGAFQGFTRRLFLENKKIVRFQEMIGADIVSPLDLVTPPGDGRQVAEKKMNVTIARIREAKNLVSKSILAGVQQGGRFLDLRRRNVEALVEIGTQYLALGSLVPFFNRNKDIAFVGEVIRQAREITGAETPIHVYGAGDPVEIPFLVFMGADIFDSSSYGHYAVGGWYMTPYGALTGPERLLAGEYACECRVCAQAESPQDIFDQPESLAGHNLWTIIKTVQNVRRELAAGTLDSYLQRVLEKHMAWFPQSKLKEAWDTLNG